jgi:hypothetical protein
LSLSVSTFRTGSANTRAESTAVPSQNRITVPRNAGAMRRVAEFVDLLIRIEPSIRQVIPVAMKG